MKMQQHWYLGFLGLAGFWKLPLIVEFFQGSESWWDLANLLWFLWFLYWIPEEEVEGK